MKIAFPSEDSTHMNTLPAIVVCESIEDQSLIMAAMLVFSAVCEDDDEDSFAGVTIGNMIDIGMEPLDDSHYPPSYRKWWEERKVILAEREKRKG
jgi:hypothetical protein